MEVPGLELKDWEKRQWEAFRRSYGTWCGSQDLEAKEQARITLESQIRVYRPSLEKIGRALLTDRGMNFDLAALYREVQQGVTPGVTT